MLNNFELSKKELENKLQKSSQILECSVAFPIMVKIKEDEMISQSYIIKEAIENL
tara:strand:- start:342 stop:506 length:165 start_codon:yes stop_codon:yes gene_type:complete